MSTRQGRGLGKKQSCDTLIWDVQDSKSVSLPAWSCVSQQSWQKQHHRHGFLSLVVTGLDQSASRRWTMRWEEGPEYRVSSVGASNSWVPLSGHSQTCSASPGCSSLSVGLWLSPQLPHAELEAQETTCWCHRPLLRHQE